MPSATQQRGFISTHPCCRPDDDLMELVWENGQIMTQGQSNKPTNSPFSNNFNSRPQEGDNQNCNSSKLAKLDRVDSRSFDFQLPVPSSETSVDHDDMMFPWLNYGMESNIRNEYSSDFVRELSGVSINEICRDKKSSFQGNRHWTAVDNAMSLKHRKQGFSEVPQILPHYQHNRPTSRSEKNDERNTMNVNNRADYALVHTLSGCPQKEVVTHNHQTVHTPMDRSLEPFPKKPTERVLCANQVKGTEDVTLEHRARCVTEGKAGERNAEPVVATSSVCSVNSVERDSNECVRDLKRKSLDTGESEDPSEKVEEDSFGARKAPPTHSSSKRTRAAEVHNLSERRRRDRINEKMRELQELIPNCNKVDKASMLDEAIEYLKTLQLQVQMMWMSGGGLYMQPMIFHPGIQPIQGPHMPHFSPMGVGMNMGLGFGFNMLDMNNSMKMIPFQGSPYAISGTPAAFLGMPNSSLQAFQHPVQRPPPVLPPLNVPVGLNVSGVAASSNAAALPPSLCPKGFGQPMLHGSNVMSSMNLAFNQLVTEGMGNPPPHHNQAQAQAQAVPQSEAFPR